MCRSFCFLSERTCPLLRVVFQRHAASPWAASAPHLAPCHPPTCMSMRWSHSTTRSPHQRNTRGLQATPLCPHPMLPKWPAPTSAAWGPSPSWSLPRTGTAQLSSKPVLFCRRDCATKGRERRKGVGHKPMKESKSWGGLTRLTYSSSLFTNGSILLLWRPGSAVVLRREIGSYWNHNRAH